MENYLSVALKQYTRGMHVHTEVDFLNRVKHANRIIANNKL